MGEVMSDHAGGVAGDPRLSHDLDLAQHRRAGVVRCAVRLRAVRVIHDQQVARLIRKAASESPEDQRMLEHMNFEASSVVVAPLLI